MATIEDLLSMRSGIPDYFAMDDDEFLKVLTRDRQHVFTTDEKLATVTELARQAIEAANRASTGVAVITSNLDKNLRDQTDKVATPVVGLSTLKIR